MTSVANRQGRLRIAARVCAIAAALLAALAAAVAAAGPAIPSLEAGDLAQGPYSAMRMTLQKTIFHINIANIDVRFDKKAQARFAALAQGGGAAGGALVDQIAPVAIAAEHAVIQMKFLHDVGLGRWMDVVRENLAQARAAGLITADIERRVSDGLPQWFAPIKDRGYEKGDRLLYEVTADALRTVVAAADGRVLIDRVEREAGTRRVVLASYFAPKSDFREPLIRSMLDKR